MAEVLNIAKFIFSITLTVIYSTLIAGKILYSYIFERHTKFWQVKKRSVPPRLTSNEFGEHKFITVNVSLLKFIKVK